MILKKTPLHAIHLDLQEMLSCITPDCLLFSHLNFLQIIDLVKNIRNFISVGLRGIIHFYLNPFCPVLSSVPPSVYKGEEVADQKAFGHLWKYCECCLMTLIEVSFFFLNKVQ